MELSLSNLIEWVESHPTTIDVLKWITVGFLAWSLGIFKFIKTKLKRPTLEIVPFTSRCIWQELGTIDGNDHNARVVFIIEAGVNNPTTDPIAIRDFTLKITRLKRRGVRNHPLNATSLPSRVRHNIGNITRYLKNWFSNFSEGTESLTIPPRIESREHQSGFLLFVSASWGYMRPLVKAGAIPVELNARLTTGENLRTRAEVVIMEDHAAFEEMVPGILDHVQHHATWNIIRTPT